MPWQSPCCAPSLLALLAVSHFSHLMFDGRSLLLVVLAGLLPHVAIMVIRLTDLQVWYAQLLNFTKYSHWAERYLAAIFLT